MGLSPGTCSQEFRAVRTLQRVPKLWPAWRNSREKLFGRIFSVFRRGKNSSKTFESNYKVPGPFFTLFNFSWHLCAASLQFPWPYDSRKHLFERVWLKVESPSLWEATELWLFRDFCHVCIWLLAFIYFVFT